MSGPAKRIRPCDACRRRKTKCVTNHGDAICVLCRFHAQQCTYQETPQPRKRGPPVAGLNDDSRPSGKRGRMVETAHGTGVEEYDALPGTTLLRRTLGLQNTHHTRHIGPNDVLDVSATSYESGQSQRSTAKAVKVRFVHPLHAFQVIPDRDAPGHSNEVKVFDEIEGIVQGFGQELVRLYFRIVHPSFPILHKDVFLEKYARSPREFAPACLAGVYILASGYWKFSEILAGQPKPDLSDLTRLAWRSFRSSVRTPKLSTVQAGLLLSQRSASEHNGEEDASSVDLTAQLVDLACGLGLNLDSGDWDIPEWESGLRRRLGWAVFMQDKWSALLSGRPSRIRDNDWIVGDLTAEDFPETVEDEAAGSSEVERGRLVYMHMSRLTVILSDLLDQLLSPRFQRALFFAPDKPTTLLGRLKPLQIRLKNWFETLPESLKMDTLASMKLSSVGYLRLAYLTVEVCVHRLLVKTISASDTTEETPITVFRSAAKERFENAVAFIQRLQALHLASFWYFTSAQCCVLVYHFGKLLEQTAADQEEKEATDRKLQEYTWSLKLNSEAGAGFMKQAISIIGLTSQIAVLTSTHHSVTTSPAMPMSTEPSQSFPGWLQAGFAQNEIPNITDQEHLAYGAAGMSDPISGWDFEMQAPGQNWALQLDALDHGTLVYPA